MSRKLILCLLFLSCIGARAAPEYVSRKGIDVRFPIQDSKATPEEIDRCAMPLFKQILSKSTFTDLHVDSIRVRDNNNDGSYGWKSYDLGLRNKVGERLRFYLELKIGVHSKEDAYILHAFLPGIVYNETIDPRTGEVTRTSSFPPSRLRNADGEIILQVSE